MLIIFPEKKWLNYVKFHEKTSNKYPINAMCDQINEEYNNLCSHIKILEFKYKKKNPTLLHLTYHSIEKTSYKYYLNQIIILIISNNNLPFFS